MVVSENAPLSRCQPGSGAERPLSSNQSSNFGSYHQPAAKSRGFCPHFPSRPTVRYKYFFFFLFLFFHSP